MAPPDLGVVDRNSRLTESFAAPLGAALQYVAVSAALIYCNKWVLAPERFPHPVALTLLHMAWTALCCALLYQTRARCFFGSVQEVLDSPAVFATRLVPLAAAFTLTVVLSNSATVYCTVPFMQMCKEMNPAIMYAAALVLGRERFSIPQALILALVLFGGCMSVQGELNFSARGLALQLSSQAFDIVKITLAALLLSRQGLGLDPLTLVLFMSPLCAVGAGLILGFSWDPSIPAQLQAAWPYVLLSCCLAFCLNLASATALKQLSGLSYVLCAGVKDVTIVLWPTLAYGAAAFPPAQQAAGFALSVCGVCFHGARKAYLEEQERIKLLQPDCPVYGKA